jgi:hypothetical protein
MRRKPVIVRPQASTFNNGHLPLINCYRFYDSEEEDGSVRRNCPGCLTRARLTTDCEHRCRGGAIAQHRNSLPLTLIHNFRRAFRCNSKTYLYINDSHVISPCMIRCFCNRHSGSGLTLTSNSSTQEVAKKMKCVRSPSGYSR